MLPLRAAAALLVALAAGPALGAGEAQDGFPSWGERVIHALMNRARVDPAAELRACGAACAEAACYGPQPPLAWSGSLARAARFHASELRRQGYFAHDSRCTVVPDIASRYPATCDGSASCACVGGASACAPTCTSWSERVRAFGTPPSGEIIASGGDPSQAFYLWLYEPSSSAACGYSSANGHRHLILASQGAVGTGLDGAAVGDFAGGAAPRGIGSGAHYPRQAAAVDAWATWYGDEAPVAAEVHLDGACVPLRLERGDERNGAWRARLEGVGDGCHRYYFAFQGTSGAVETWPTTGTLGIGGEGCEDWLELRAPAGAGCLAAGGSAARLTGGLGCGHAGQDGAAAALALVAAAALAARAGRG